MDAFVKVASLRIRPPSWPNNYATYAATILIRDALTAEKGMVVLTLEENEELLAMDVITADDI